MYLAKLTLQTHGAQGTQVKLSKIQSETNRAESGLSRQFVEKRRDKSRTQTRDNPNWSHPSQVLG